MMVNNQVQVKDEKSEYFGRAGWVVSLTGRDEKETATVRLDESETHESGDADFLVSDLRLLS